MPCAPATRRSTTDYASRAKPGTAAHVDDGVRATDDRSGFASTDAPAVTAGISHTTYNAMMYTATTMGPTPQNLQPDEFWVFFTEDLGFFGDAGMIEHDDATNVYDNCDVECIVNDHTVMRRALCLLIANGELTKDALVRAVNLARALD
jgi:hypothetical protein